MRGIPTIFGTRDDVYNGMKEDASATKKRLQGLLDARWIWAPTMVIAEGEEGIEDDTHNLVHQEVRDDETGEVSIEVWQYELQEDPNAWVFRLGFTVDEGQGLIEN